MTGEPQADRRESIRYAVNRDLYLTFWPSMDRVGRLRDVSGGGVAFEYAVLDQKEKVVDVEVNIFASRPDHFMLWRVPCQVVYERKIERPTLSSIETRRCGLRFKSLSEHQADQLNLLLTRYASGPLAVGPG
jgi:hypothetical protein